jgi:hypothetical protein
MFVCQFINWFCICEVEPCRQGIVRPVGLSKSFSSIRAKMGFTGIIDEQNFSVIQMKCEKMYFGLKCVYGLSHVIRRNITRRVKL